MNSQPYYQLRSNKYIDRKLFVNMLTCLSRFYNISKYCYTGFGSYMFDDFKLLHESLHITNMISLESDLETYKRAEYNRPYKCINILNMTSTDYITNQLLDASCNNIVWLDFNEPSSIGTQLSDFSNLLKLLKPHDIIRITLNANPACLGGDSKNVEEKREQRLKKLKVRIDDTYISASITQNDMSSGNYPLTLLGIVKAVAQESLEIRPPYQMNYLFPLFSSVYADGQQMLTFTGIILESQENEDIKRAFNLYNYMTFKWDKPCHIKVPNLTTKEIIELNKRLPLKDEGQPILAEFPFLFDMNELNSYIEFYKYYPNFHHVSF